MQLSTTIHQQPLISPLPIETTAAEEILIKENIHVFEANGFKLHIDECQPPGKRVKVCAFPFSKSVQFGVEDIHELASLLEESCSDRSLTTTYVPKVTIKNNYLGDKSSSIGKDYVLRLPKLLTMFASRACRSAVMIGTALKTQEMQAIINQLANIEQPWNCPHGRPTMRHLASIKCISKSC